VRQPSLRQPSLRQPSLRLLLLLLRPATASLRRASRSRARGVSYLAERVGGGTAAVVGFSGVR
jgi:hypothetical protein